MLLGDEKIGHNLRRWSAHEIKGSNDPISFPRLSTLIKRSFEGGFKLFMK